MTITKNFDIPIGAGLRPAIAELACRESARRGGRVIIIAPYTVIGKQWESFGYPVTTTTPERLRHKPLDPTEADIIILDESQTCINRTAMYLQDLPSEIWLINCPIPMADLPPSRWSTRPWDPMPPELREQTEHMQILRNRLFVAEINAIPVPDTSTFDK